MRKRHFKTGNMIFGVQYLVWRLSRRLTLDPGDVINAGTPQGWRCPRFPYLGAGDVMELEIDGLGRQRQVLALAESETEPGGVETVAASNGRRVDEYALDEEHLPGVRCVAAPLLDDGKRLIAALPVTAPSNRCGEDWPARPLQRLRATARMVRAWMDLDPNPVFGAA